MLDWLSDKVEKWARPASEPATELYAAVAEAARNPDFYSAYGVDDSVDGRFDTLVLHAALVVRRLSAMAGGSGGELAQGVIDTMFADLDLSLHEMGVSDTKVGGKVKTMAKAWLGRMTAYDVAIAGGDRTVLARALERNLYRESGTDALGNDLADAVLRADSALGAMGDDAVTPEAVAAVLAGLGTAAHGGGENAGSRGKG